MKLAAAALSIGLASATFLSSSSANAAAVQWDISSHTYVIAGTGCQRDVDAFAATNGNDLSIVFTNLGVNLPGDGVSRQLADRKTCALRIPATIQRGYYIGRLTQQFTYGVTKTANSNAAVATRSTFFGFDVSPYAWSVPNGVAIDEPLLTQRREDDFLVRSTWWAGWCNATREPRGLYQANIAVSGQRASRREDLIVFVDGLDLKYEVLASLFTC